MIIELSYGQVFWIGVLVGVVLAYIFKKLFRCLSEVKLSGMNNEERQEFLDMKNLGYLPVPSYLEPKSFKYSPVDYLKYLYEPKLHNQGQMPDESGISIPLLKETEKSHPLPEYNPNK